MTNAIRKSLSLKQIVSSINHARKGEGVLCADGLDTRSPEHMAAQFALDCCISDNNISGKNIDSYLDMLYDCGASFAYQYASTIAHSRAKFLTLIKNNRGKM